MADTYELAGCHWHRRRTDALVSFLAIVALCIMVIGGAAGSMGVVITAGLSAVLCWLSNMFGPTWRSGGSLRLDARGLTIADDVLFREEIVSGYRVDPRSAVVLMKGGRELRFELAKEHDAADVDRILDHLDSSLRRRALRIPIGHGADSTTTAFASWLLLQPAGCVAGSLLRWSTGAASFTMIGIFLIPILLARWVGKRIAPLELVVGTEGVFVHRKLVRFVTMSAIAAYPEPPRSPIGILLRQADGREIRVVVKGASRDTIRTVVQRIRDGFAASAGKVDAAAQLEAIPFRRGELAVREWRAHLVDPADLGGSFRAPAVPTEDAVSRVLANAALPIDERVGAAIVLRGGSEADRVKVRIAADATVDPELERALRAVLEDEIDERVLHEVLVIKRAKWPID